MRPLVLTSISWIDRKNLSTPGLLNLVEALIGHSIGWDDRTVIGLIATSNPTPPPALPKLKDFLARRQYRAVASLTLDSSLARITGEPLLDPGWTPPFDKHKLPRLAQAKSPPREALAFHAGECSAVSGSCTGKLLPTSSFSADPQRTVITNQLIKFRAGAATNKLGKEEAHSPFHVPWVWCETLLARSRGRLELHCRGSQFPSHAWYVNGKRVALHLQAPVHASPDEPALSKGRPSKLVRLRAEDDKSSGKVQDHAHTVGAGKATRVDLSAMVH